MTYRRQTLLTLALAGVSMFQAVPALAQVKPLRVGWVFAMANAPAVIAEQKRFFAEEGLSVELKSFGDGPVLQQALAAGELDVAYVGAPPVYQWFSRGLDARILAKVNFGQAAVISSSAGPIKAVADLRGKRLASVAKGSGMDVLLRGFVLKEQAKLDPDKDLSILPMPPANMNAALDRNVADAAFLWEPFVSQALLRGNSRLVMDLNQALPQYPWYVVMAPTATLKERGGDVVKLLRAHHKAIAFLKQQPAESNQIIAQAFKLEAVQAPDGKTIAPESVVQEARKRLGWSDQLEASDLRFIQRLMDYSLTLGFISQPLKVEQVVDQSYWVKANAGLAR
ncbi:ABC transporter substrate-binding protein [Aquabacterium sp. CECT 9606]|uniref:ABC transporter substrate-binding protein n=1 Tax=Aquabacterium sp. CECT 9606 TaxID=2845822 RepID=UPI001E43D616|nr:ABC transporter substrate-binding protein [Aquabacterium sp. CECT 9606]CAH0347895.1 Putative aliphatic sulfonates-binding protein [Aquabacterium sp. CECT 9606]